MTKDRPTNPTTVPATRLDYLDSWGVCLRMLTLLGGGIALPALVPPLLFGLAGLPLSIPLAVLSASVLRRR